MKQNKAERMMLQKVNDEMNKHCDRLMRDEITKIIERDQRERR